MGYLDHSTNNIILDAVLTDAGRKKLSQSGNNNIVFNVEKFALGDDEVDYSIIQKYGRTLGKEKIEKNTPVFEALTNESIALKYKTFGDANMASMLTVRLPYFNTISKVTLTTSSQPVSAVVYYGGQQATPDNMNLFSTNFNLYYISYSDRFLNVTAPTGTTTSINSDSSDANKTRTLKLTYARDLDVSSVDFSISRKTISDQDFQIYGYATTENNVGNRVITTYVTVTGPLGMKVTFAVDCKKI